MTISKSLFLFLFTLVSINLLQSQCNVICNSAPNESDFDALKQLYCDTDGENWKNNEGWYESLNQGLGCNYCEWYGVICEDGRVVELSLFFNGLIGPIPSKISKLKKLRKLQLSSNDISGNLPGSIGQLTELEELWLAGNEFHSPMPPEIGQLINLRSLNVDYAPFTGAIPEEIGNLSNLEYLNIVDNFFTSYPQSLGNLTKLKTLQMWDSFDDGLPFPDFLGNFPDLEGVRIAGDAMTGSFPVEILDFPNLRYIHLDDNALTGQLPNMVVNLDSLENVNISNNDFHGGFTLDFSECEKFRSLDISHNDFTGSFPEGLGNIESLIRITATNNNFSGCFPADLYNKCDESIYFGNNIAMSFNGDFDQFCGSDGTIETQIGSKCDDGIGSSDLDYIDGDCLCKSCAHPDLNALLKLYYSSSFSWINTGTKSEPNNTDIGWGKDCDICDWYGITCNSDNRVTKIILPENGLSQSISLQFQGLPFLEELDLSNNSINSALPKLDSMDNLKSVNFSNNQFYSTLPTEWTSKTDLESIDVHNNKINGFIPSEYDMFSLLRYIDFSNNRLNGVMPFNATSNPKLEFINLFRNSFTGELPIEFGDMIALEYLNLSSNLFEGCIPDSYRFFCTNGTLDLSNNNGLPWRGDLALFCESENIDSQNGAHCGYNSAGYFEDCQCINLLPDCVTSQEILCKPWVQNFGLSLPCTEQNKYKIFTSRYGNIPVIMFNQGQQIASKSVITQYIFTCQGQLLENCSFSQGSNCNYDESIYKQIQDDLIQIFSCQDDQFPTDCENLCAHPDLPALMSFYGATQGGSWTDNTGWADGFDGTNCDPCDGWFGVECDDQGRVIALDLLDNNLTGNLPSALFDMEELMFLSLSRNQLSGTIFSKIKNLSKLNSLFLSENDISGNIPKELHEIPTIQKIYLSENQLSGTIPEFEIELPNLEEYIAYNNEFTSFLGNVNFASNLEAIGLAGNNISETLDTMIFDLEHLEVLNLSNNNITGSLPEYIASSPVFIFLNLSDNQLSGQVPESFGTLEKLITLSLSKNQLSGQLPESLKNLGNAIDISLAQNQFSGPLPTFVQFLGDNISYLDLNTNNFEGCIDSSYLSICNTTIVEISNNPLLDNDNWQLFCATQEGICEDEPPMNTTPYYPMAIENANWIFEVTDEGFKTYYGWRIEGDTLINGLAYKKGFRIDVEHNVAPPYQELFYTINPNNPVFFMRDDTIQKKVYAIYAELQDPYNCQPISIGEEVLTYDFEPGINDSIYCADGMHIVSDIDTVEYFGYDLPRNTINNGNRIQYQQIGDPEGLFFDINYVFVDTYSERLIEYCIRDEVGCFHMFDPIATNEIEDDDEVLLYPSPAIDKVTISSAKAISAIDIYSIDGRIIYSINDVDRRDYEISLEGEASQVLVALIKLGDGGIVRKLFVKR